MLLGLIGFVLSLIVVPGKVQEAAGALVWFDNHYSYLGHALRDYASPLLGAFFIGLGVYALARRAHRAKESVWLAACFLVPLVMAMFFWRRNVGPQYIFFALPFGMMLAAAGSYAVIDFLAKEYGGKEKRTIFIAAGLLLAALLLPNYGALTGDDTPYKQTAESSSPDYRKVFSFVMKERSSGDAFLTRRFRNYYFAGAKAPVLDFGGELSERNLSVEDIEAFTREHPKGYAVLSSNDFSYISKATEQYMDVHFEKVSNSQVRGPVTVYRWGK